MIIQEAKYYLKKIVVIRSIVYGLRKMHSNICILLGTVSKPFLRLFERKGYAIVKIEGGITSQMEQYTLGKCLGKLGYDVKYDISWYENGCGKDCEGKDARNFDITKAFRNIDFEIASKKDIAVYRKYYRYSEKISRCQALRSSTKIQTPVYLAGYGYGIYSEPIFEVTFCESLKFNYDEAEFGFKNTEMLNKIKSSECIGVHVRRGDTLLATVGRPIPKKEYYLAALDYYSKNLPIYIFSDGMDWVEKSLLPYIPNKERVELVNINGADRGWCDLILMSACTHQVKSPSGGLGRDAFRLNQNTNKSAVMPAYLLGNMSSLSGNIFEIIVDESNCDMQYVTNRKMRL